MADASAEDCLEVLIALDHDGEPDWYMPQGQVSRQVHPPKGNTHLRSRGAVPAILRRLEAEGLVERNPHIPITYLHDPDTGKPFAALIQLDEADKVDMGLEEVEHNHLEGDEDEY